MVHANFIICFNRIRNKIKIKLSRVKVNIENIAHKMENLVNYTIFKISRYCNKFT